MDVGSEEPSTPLGQKQESEAFSSPTPSSQTLSPQLFLPSPFAHQAHSSFAAEDDALSGNDTSVRPQLDIEVFDIACGTVAILDSFCFDTILKA